MSRLSFRLARAAASGRSNWRPLSREEILARLLMKRAAAHQAGLHDLESKLRDQIAWSLPVRRGREDDLATDGPRRRDAVAGASAAAFQD